MVVCKSSISKAEQHKPAVYHGMFRSVLLQIPLLYDLTCVLFSCLSFVALHLPDEAKNSIN